MSPAFRKPSLRLAPASISTIDEPIVVPAQLTRGQFIYAYSLITSLFFAWGFAYGLLDSLNKHFQNVFGITKTESTFMQVAYFGVVWAPIAGTFMRKVGYRNGIFMGLIFYSLAAILYWPVAVKQSYAGFVILTFWMAMGLSTLEVAANTYITILGDPKWGAMRLTFSQSWNGIGAFAGPLIASKSFFNGENSTSLGSVQYVYLAVGCFGGMLIVLFYFAKLPEIDETSLQDTLENQEEVAPLHKQWHTIFGFLAQFSYVGAQVALATFTINFLADTPSIAFNTSKAALWLSYAQMVFALGRFMGAIVLRFLDPAYTLLIYSTLCAAFTIGVTMGTGKTAIACLFVVFYFESVCWPTIYSLAIARLGKHTKLGGSLVVAGVGGGALYSPLQGVWADNVNVQVSFWVPFVGYCITIAYALGMSVDKHRRAKIDLKTGRVRETSAVYAEDGGSMEKAHHLEGLDSEKMETEKREAARAF